MLRSSLGNKHDLHPKTPKTIKPDICSFFWIEKEKPNIFTEEVTNNLDQPDPEETSRNEPQKQQPKRKP